jgi:excisionase family DNA binding protein
VAPDRWLTVGEAAHALGMSRTTLLAAEEAGLLTPMRTPGGHRRYSPAELDRFLSRSGAAPAPQPAAAAPYPGRPAEPAGLGPAVRTAVRPLVQALDADSGGLYLWHGGALRFTAAFGVPRWLAERLRTITPAAPLVAAAETGRHRLFDAAGAGFPEPRSVGHGVATPLTGASGPLGVLFLIRPHELLPGEVRAVEAFGELLGAFVDDQRRIAELQQRLTRIAALSAPDAS